MSNEPMTGSAQRTVDMKFRGFADNCLQQTQDLNDDRQIAGRIARLVAEFLPRWRIVDPRYERPQHNQLYGSYLLYLHPDGKFCVAQDIFLPGQTTGVHNHGTWGVIGVVRGLERERRYAVPDRLDLPPRQVEVKEHSAGAVSIVLPDKSDWHAIECAGPEPSISLHVYGADIGRRTRLMWDDTQRSFIEFRSGYSNDSEMLPTYLLAGN